jgi:mono/diheme cytochrome c family protein
LVVAAAVLGLAALWFLTTPSIVPAAALLAHSVDLANGKEMFFAGGCASCHATPDQPDNMRLGGGLALGSPFGTFYVPNISSDIQDGIGAWTEAQFVTALRMGTSPKGQHYYPALPYTSYRLITFDDSRDLFAYLKTLPAVKSRTRDHELSFPFSIRRMIGIWKLLFFASEPFGPEAAKGALWNRGAYLANGPAHCAECHSPRNAFGAVIASFRFTGGPSPDGRGRVPNITQFKLLKNWSESDLVKLLKEGLTPRGDGVHGMMVDVVGNTSHLSDQDLAAIATYIKSLPPLEGQPRPRN